MAEMHLKMLSFSDIEKPILLIKFRLNDAEHPYIF